MDEQLFNALRKEVREFRTETEDRLNRIEAAFGIGQQVENDGPGATSFDAEVPTEEGDGTSNSTADELPEFDSVPSLSLNGGKAKN